MFNTIQEKDAVFEMMTLCALITVSTNLNMILSTGYGNSNLSDSVFLHQTLLNTDSLKWKLSLYIIIYSLLVFFKKDLFIRRHIMGSTEPASETRIFSVGLLSSTPC